MTSRYLRKHYKKEDILSYSRLIKGFYRFLFEEFSPRKILREILANAKEAGTFQITRQKKQKTTYFILSFLFHLLCFLFTDYYQRHYAPPPLIIADTSFDQSAIQLVNISSETHKNIKTSGGKPQDSPQPKSTQGIPEEMVRMARAEKPVLTPPAPEKFLNKIFRRAIKVKRSSKTQKLPNTQSKKMELARVEQSRNLPPIKRDIKTKKPSPPRKPIKEPVKQPARAKPLLALKKPATQKLVKKKVPQAMPKETKPVKPAVSLQRKQVKAISPAETKVKIITPTPSKIESSKAAPKALHKRTKLAHQAKTKKIAKQKIKQPTPIKQAPAPQKPTAEQPVKKVATLRKPLVVKPAKPTIPPKRNLEKPMAKAKTKTISKTPVPSNIESVKAAPKTHKMRKKLAHQAKTKKIAKQKIKQQAPIKQAPAPQKPTAEQVIKKVAQLIKPSMVKPAKPTIPPKRNLEKPMAKAKTKTISKTPAPSKIESSKAAPKTLQVRTKLAHQAKTKKIARQKIKQQAPVKPVPAPQKPTAEQPVKKVAALRKPSMVKPAKPTITQKRDIVKSMAKAKTKTISKTPAPSKIESIKAVSKALQVRKKLAHQAKTKKIARQKIKQQAPIKQAPAPQKPTAEQPVKKVALPTKHLPVKPTKPTIAPERKIVKAMATAKTKAKVTSSVPRKLELAKAKAKPKMPESRKLAYEPEAKKAIKQPARPDNKQAPKTARQETKKLTLTAPKTRKAKADLPKLQISRHPVVPPPPAPRQQREKPVAEAVVTSPKRPEKKREVSLKKQGKTLVSATKRLEYEATIRKAENLPKIPPIKTSPIKPRAVPIAELVQKNVTHTPKKTAINAPTISPKPVQKVVPSSSIILAREGDKTFTIELIEKPKTVAKLRRDFQGQKALSAPSSKQPHVPKKLEDIEQLLKLSPKLGLVSSATRKKITALHKTSLRKNTKEFRMEKGPEKEWKKEVQYTQTQAPKTKELQKELSYEKSNSPHINPTSKRVATVDSKTSIASRSVQGPENISQKTSTLLEPVIARDIVAKAARKVTPHKRDEGFPLRENNFSLPIQLTPEPDKTVLLAKRSTSNPSKALEGKDVEYSKTPAPIKVKHQLRLQYKTESTLRAEREITGPEVEEKKSTLAISPGKKNLPSLQQATKTQPAIPNNDIVSLNREESRHLISPSYERKDKILRDTQRVDKTRPETTQVTHMAMTSPKSTERPVKLRKIRYEMEQQKNIRRFEGNVGEPSLLLTGQQVTALDVATKKIIQPTTLRNIRQPFMPMQTESSPRPEKKITTIQQVTKYAEMEEKSLAYSEHRLRTIQIEQKKQTAPETNIAKTAQIIQKLKQAIFDISAPEEKIAATATRTATPRVAVEKIRGKLSNLIIKDPYVTPAEREFVEADHGKTRDITEQKILDFKEKGIESVEVEQERLVYQKVTAQVAERIPEGPETSGLEGPFIEERTVSKTDALVEKKVTQITAEADLSAQIEVQEISPEQEIARELLVAQMAADVIRKLMEEKNLEYAEAETTAERVEQQRVKFNETAAEVAERASAGPEVAGLEGPFIEERSETKTTAEVEKKITQITAEADLSAQVKVQEISPEQEIARELLVAQMAADIIRKMMEEKDLEYAAAGTTAERVTQQRVKFNETATEVAERASAGPEVAGLEGPSIEKRTVTKTDALVLKKITQITAEADLSAQVKVQEISPEQEIARELLVAQMAADVVRKMMEEKNLEYTAAGTTAERVTQQRVKFNETATEVAERASAGPEVAGLEGPSIEERSETKTDALVEKKITQITAEADLSAQVKVQEISPEQEIARELLVAQMAADVIREMMGEKDLEYTAAGTTAERVTQQRVKFNETAAEVAERASAGPEVAGLEGPSIEKRTVSKTDALVEKKITQITAEAGLSAQVKVQEISPEQEIARELLMAQLTADVVRKMMEKEALEYTTAKTKEKVEQEKVQYQPAAKHNIQMDIPETAMEVAAEPSVETAPSEQTILSHAQRTGEHFQAQRTENTEQDAIWTDVTKAVSLYIEKALDRGAVKEVEAATGRDVHTDKELGYQAKMNAPAGISQERVEYEPDSSGPQERLGTGPQQIEISEQMREAKKFETYDKVERIHTAKLREEKIPVMASDFHSYSSAVPVTTVDKESPEALLGNSEVKTRAIEKEFQYEQRKETHDQVLIDQKRVRYQNQSNHLAERSTTGPESIVSQAEEFKELSGEAESRSTSNLDNIAKKTFSYKEQIDSPVIRSTEFAKVDAKKNLNRKQALDNALSSLTARSDKSLPRKQMAMVDRKKIDTSFTSGIKQGKKGVKLMDSLASRPKMEKKRDLLITIERPFSNMTRQPLYTLRGTIEKDVKLIFVTTNEVTQMVPVVNGKFSAKLSMTKGINDIDILGYNSSGGIGQISSKILFTPHMPVPVVKLLSPQNGQQGMREGDAVLVKGIINDRKISNAILYLNNIPIKIGVKNGVFKRKIFMPRGRVITFRIMATNKDGGTGYSPMHTILAGYEIDIINPRPY